MKFEQQKSDSMRIFAADFGMNGLPVNSGRRWNTAMRWEKIIIDTLEILDTLEH